MTHARTGRITSARGIAASARREVAGRLLVLDFDGTVCVGDGPVLAYANAVIAHATQILAPEDAATLTQRVRSRVLSRGASTEPESDGYGAVAAAARGLLPEGHMHAAYLSSRRALAAGSLAVSAPPGLADLLGSLSGRALRIIVTNAPETGVEETLSVIGLDGLIDGIIPSARKPDGWSALLPPLLSVWPARSIMAVGDFWANDLAGPRNLGCRTALIDAFDRSPGPCDLRGRRFEDLYDGIRRWAHTPASPTAPQYPGPDPEIGHSQAPLSHDCSAALRRSSPQAASRMPAHRDPEDTP